MRYLLTSLLCVFTLSLTAQLPNGSVAPDFTATDIDGNEWNLYDLLDEGNTVILNFGATWQGNIWVYAQTGILQDLYSTFGPEGTGDLYVFFLESEDFTTEADLNGTGPSTAGDWVSIINYPIIDNASNIFDSYSSTYYPTIYTVCPDGTLNANGVMEYTLAQSYQTTFDGHVAAAFMDCSNSITGAAPLMAYNGETSSCGGGEWMASTSVSNPGSDDVTAMIFAVELNGVAQSDVTWSGVLSNGGNETVDLGSYNESGTFNYSLVSVNGADWNAEEAVNIVGSTDATSYIQVRITTDNWPEETGWTIESASGMYIDGVATGELAGQVDSEFTWDVALNLDECYVFTMIDTYGDGLNASQWGNYVDGSAQIIDLGNLASVIWSVEGDMVFAEIIFVMNTIEFINGCTTPFACNYDPEATTDDGSCEFICFGCTDSVACNYDSSANVEDNSCEYLSCAGCTDATACNFNSESTIDDGSCLYPEQYYDCWGGCINDIDSDDICDELEIPGCTDEGSCNFNLEATDDDESCEYETCAGCQYEFACNYDPEATIADNESCEYGTCPGCTDNTACNYNPTVSEDDGSCEYCSCNNCSDGCTDNEAVNYNPEATENDFSCIYEGCVIEVACNYNPEASIDDGSCIFFCSGCTDETACNYDSYFLQDDGSCVYPGCIDMNACNYDANAACTDNNCQYFDECEVCGGEGTLGCNEPSACNYDIAADCDDMSCVFSGCMDSVACNFDANAGCDDGDCEYESCTGCMYELACNYDSEYSIANNESCEFGTCPGCTDLTACNYNPTVSEDDGSCLYLIDECGICGGSGFPEGECDCDGNTLDEWGVCGCSEIGGVDIINVDFGDGLIIPDDQMQCFSSQLTVTDFNDGAILNDANNDIINLFMNFEHSYMGDITITFICPSGQSILVHQQGGNGTYLGVPIDNDADLTPGVGWDYWWEPGATNGTWADNAVSAGTLASGVYESVQPFSNLDGCPLNGTWEVEVCDFFGSDNGFIFNWSMEISDIYFECDCCGVPNGDGTTCDGVCGACNDNSSCLDDCGVPNGDGTTCPGCTDSAACNYDINASSEDGSCLYIDECGECGGEGILEGDCDCDGNVLDATGICGGDCTDDYDGDGVCDELEVYGCTYPDAMNFDSLATADDGSCLFDDLSSDCPADIDGNGIVTTQDLLSFLSFFGEVCE